MLCPLILFDQNTNPLKHQECKALISNLCFYCVTWLTAISLPPDILPYVQPHFRSTFWPSPMSSCCTVACLEVLDLFALGKENETDVLRIFLWQCVGGVRSKCGRCFPLEIKRLVISALKISQCEFIKVHIRFSFVPIQRKRELIGVTRYHLHLETCVQEQISPRVIGGQQLVKCLLVGFYLVWHSCKSRCSVILNTKLVFCCWMESTVKPPSLYCC